MGPLAAQEIVVAASSAPSSHPDVHDSAEAISSDHATSQQDGRVPAGRVAAATLAFVERVAAYAKAVASPVVTTLALSPFVLVHRIQEWIGRYAFLSYVFFILFFFPAPVTVGRFFESSILSIIAAGLGIGLCVLAVAAGIWIDGEGQPFHSSVQSRAVGACTIVLLSLIAGITSSAIPRLKAPSRCGLFASVWALTSGYTRVSSAIFTEMFYPIVLAAVLGLLGNVLVFPRTARSTYFQLVIETLDTMCDAVERAIDDFFPPPADNDEKADVALNKPGSASPELQALRGRLVSLNARFNPTFQAAENEISIGRVPIGKFKAFIHLQRSMRSWISCGMGLRSCSDSADVDVLQTVEDVVDGDGEGPRADRDVATGRPPNRAPHLGKARDTSVDSVPCRVEIRQFEPAVRSLGREVVGSLRLVRISIEMSTGRVRPSQFPQGVQGKKGGLPFVHAVDGALLAATSVGTAQTTSAVIEPLEVLSKQRLKLREAITAFKDTLREALKSVRNATDGPGTQEHGLHRHVVNGSMSHPQHRETGTPLSSDHGRDGQTSYGEHGAKTGGDFASLFRSELYAVSFLMVSLLEIALLSEDCIRVGQSILRSWQRHKRRRIWLPDVTWKTWLKRSGDARIGETYSESAELLDDDDHDGPAGENGDGAFERSKAESTYFDRDDDSEICRHYAAEQEAKGTPRISMRRPLLTLRLFARRMSRNTTILKLRLRLSRTIRRLRHSRHIKFGIKLALGVSLLSLPAWLGRGPARTWWYEKRGQWMVISYLYVLESSTGASFRVSLFRIIGTISGSIIGLCISEISQDNRYALGFLVALAYVPATHFMLFTRAEGIGIVMGLTAPIIALLPTLDKTSESTVDLAWNRGYMIALGIIAALVVNVCIWPLHARVELVRQISRCTVLLQSLYLGLSRQMLTGGFVASAETTAAFERMENSVERKISNARGLVSMMEAEITLIPKRTDVLSEILSRLLTIAELLRGLRRCREHGLRSIRREAVINVLELRQNVIASVLIVLWSSGQALLSHAPLPQFLPSPRLALAELTAAVAEQLSGDRPQPRPAAEADQVPDAYHALSTLADRLSKQEQQQRGRRRSALHSLQTSTPTPARTGSITPTHAHTPTTPYSDRGRMHHYASFFILAEHALLSDIVAALESLMELTRTLVGEASFLRTEFVPRGEDVDGHYPAGADDRPNRRGGGDGGGATGHPRSAESTVMSAHSGANDLSSSLGRALRLQMELDQTAGIHATHHSLPDRGYEDREDNSFNALRQRQASAAAAAAAAAAEGGTAQRRVRIETDPTLFRMRNRTAQSPLRGDGTRRSGEADTTTTVLSKHRDHDN